jgi:hypothetical protein
LASANCRAIGAEIANVPKKFRFAVGSPSDVRSSVWTIKTNRNDVYLMATSGGDIYKASLHLSTTNDRIAFTSESGQTFPGTTDRTIGEWTRPAPFGLGWTDALHILVPGVDLGGPRPPVLAIPTAIEWVRAPSTDERAHFHVYIAERDHSALYEEEVDQVGPLLSLADGGFVLLVVRFEPTPEADAALAREYVKGARYRGAPDNLRVQANVHIISLEGPVIMDLPLSEMTLRGDALG